MEGPETMKPNLSKTYEDQACLGHGAAPMGLEQAFASWHKAGVSTFWLHKG